MVLSCHHGPGAGPWDEQTRTQLRGTFAPWARTSGPDPVRPCFGHAVTIESTLIIRSPAAIRNPPGSAAFTLECALWFRSKISRLKKRASLMSIAESAARLSATVLLGKGLTPGKLRGLQRISNPDGTLTMLALDQNSSVIEMATKALQATGEDRDPTYEEIVEAKLDLMRNLAPAASGVLIDAYYGAWSAIASEAISAGHRAPGPVRDVGQPQEQGGRADGGRRAGLERREDQADGRRRRQAAGPVRAHRADLGRAPVPARRARVPRVQAIRHPAAAGDRLVSLRRREEDRRQLPGPQGRGR